MSLKNALRNPIKTALGVGTVQTCMEVDKSKQGNSNKGGNGIVKREKGDVRRETL